MRRSVAITVCLATLCVGVGVGATETVTVFDRLHLLDARATQQRSEADRMRTQIAATDDELAERWMSVDIAQRAAGPIRESVTQGLARWLGAHRAAQRGTADGPQAPADTRRLLRYSAGRALPGRLRDVDVVRRADSERAGFRELLARRGQWSIELARSTAGAVAADGSRGSLIEAVKSGGAEEDIALTTAALDEQLAAVPPALSDVDFHRVKGTLARPIAASPESRFGASGALVRSNGWTYRPAAGDDVHAIHDGIVTFRAMVQGHGLVVAVDHGSGYRATYNHLQTADVRVGDKVNRADVIARAGESGSVDGVRLHFTLRKDGQPVDPDGWFLKR